jgi:pantothenate kinase
MDKLSNLNNLQKLKEINDKLQITELMDKVLNLSSVLHVDQFGQKTITFDLKEFEHEFSSFKMLKQLTSSEYFIDSTQLIPILVDLIKFQQLSIQALSLRLHSLEHKNEC